MLNHRLPKPPQDRGATAIFLAFCMLLLLGVAAVVLDLSSAFNQRNQNQNAGDNGVMSGALEKAVGDPIDQLIVTRALEVAQSNLTADFPGGLTDPAWIAMWRACTDDGNPGWIPLPEPATWGGGGTLDCISQTTHLLRVRVPDQLLDTTFGTLLGVDQLATNAVSIAKVTLLGEAPPVVPYAVATGSTGGEYCLSSAPSGTAWPPCTGSQTGAFGSIISPLFGHFGMHDPQCTGNTIRWFERNLAWGLDHRIRVWDGGAGVPLGSTWPGNAGLNALANINRDDCVLDPDGNATPVNGIPINTLKIDTGFPDPGVTNALVSDQIFDGRPARLQQLSPGVPRHMMNQNEVWEVDNVGPWKFLDNDGSDPAECRSSTYQAIPDTDAKVAAFNMCLSLIDPTGAFPDTEVFLASITYSPRFVWVPELVYELGSGTHFNPVRRFRPAFIGGVWLNCPSPLSSQPCGAVFFPDEEVTDPICDGIFPSCKKVTVDQVSSWLLPDKSIPQSAWDDFEAAFDNLEPELYQ